MQNNSKPRVVLTSHQRGAWPMPRPGAPGQTPPLSQRWNL